MKITSYLDSNFIDLQISKPDWYLLVLPYLKGLLSDNLENKNNLKQEIYNYFTEKYKNNQIYISNEGPDFDTERKIISKVIIHHTHNMPGMSLDLLSAIEIIQLYGPYFMNPYIEGDNSIKGKGIYSGHFRDGKQVFWPYHWIIREDGSYERLLYDNEIGWHAGDWSINCESVGICFDNNFDEHLDGPNDKQIKSFTDILNSNYPNISKDNIYGHSEVGKVRKTSCPGESFLSGKHGKNKILDNLL